VNLKSEFERLLSPVELKFCYALSTLAFDDGVRAWLTGGIVRDLLLGKGSKDLDISVSACDSSFVEKVANSMGLSVTARFEHYGCIVLKLSDGSRCDVLSLRKESYSRPAAVPDITFIDSIEKDLYRRDFTINAMAVSLNRENFGELLDFYGGYEDLQNRLLRVIHRKSLLDDPVRIFRGIRFAVRMDLSLADETTVILNEAYRQKALFALSSEVFLRELEHTFKAIAPVTAIDMMNQWRLWDALGWPGNIGEILSHASFLRAVIEEVRKNKGYIKSRKCFWLGALSLLVLTPPQGLDYFCRRFSPPSYILNYLNEVKRLYLKLKDTSVAEILVKPRKAEVLTGALILTKALTCNELK